MLTHFTAQSKQDTSASATQRIVNVNGDLQTKIDNINSLLVANRYEEAELGLEALLPIAQGQNNKSILGLAYVTFGKLYYQKKQYENAIVQYKQATTLLDGEEDTAKKLLASSYHQIAQSFKHLKDLPKSINNYKKSLAIHSFREDTPAIARALKNIAMAENRLQNHIPALDYARRSIELQSVDSSPSDYAQIALLTGIIYRNIGHYEKSLEYIQQAKVIYEQEKDVLHLAEVDNQLGLIYSSLNHLSSARSFYHQSIDLPIDQVKPETRAAAFREIGVIDYNDGEFIRAIEMFNKALNIYQSTNNISRTTRVNLLLGTAYLKIKNRVLATRYFHKSLALATQLNQVELEAESLNYLGQIMLEQDIDKAILLLKRSLILSEKIDNQTEQITTYKWLTECEKVKGDMAQALYYSEKRYAISLLIQKQQEKLDLAKAKAILESYKLEEDLNDLRERAELDALKLTQKNNEIEIIQQAQHISELEIKKERFANIFLTIVLIVCAVAALYILRSFKNTRARNQELDYLASRDPLTNCFNRRILFERFNKHFQNESVINQYSVILADVDFFKSINDNYGHSTGDKVLQGIAKILQDNTSECDTVARFGGEEFCILLPKASLEEAVKIAEQMRKTIEVSTFEGAHLTCSFGVSSLNTDTECHLSLIERADAALYQSKFLGRNTVTLWDKSFNQNFTS
jgi:diguanylate cyclase (GGDEF)-like protein